MRLAINKVNPKSIMTFGVQLACFIWLFTFRAEHLQYSLGNTRHLSYKTFN